MIYSFAVPWPTFTELPHSAECTLSPEFEDNTNGYKGQAPCYDDRRLWPPKLQCPTILLICRQITDEVFEELDRSPLIFDEPPPHLLHYEFEPLDRIPHRYCLTNYLSPDRLCTARRIEILVKPSIVPNPCPSPQLVANPQMLYRRLYDSWSCFVDYLLYIWRRKTPLLEHLTLRLRVSATPNSRSRQDLIKRLASVLRMLKPECEIKIEVDDPELEWQLRAKVVVCFQL